MFCKGKAPISINLTSLSVLILSICLTLPVAAQEFIPVWIDPAVAFQGEEPMTFTAHVPEPFEAASYEWRLGDEEGDVLGTESTLTLAPDLEEDEVLNVLVTDAEGNQGFALSFIITGENPNGPPPGGEWIHVNIDPPVVIQGDEPLTFTATVHDGEPVDSYVWTRDDTAEVLGETMSITLEPTFEMVTTLTCTVKRGDAEGQAWATIIVDPGEQPNPSLFVMIDPPVVFQEENELIEFEAVVEGTEPFTYEWIREDTGEVIGTEAEITLEPTFEEPTPIFLTVTDNDGNEGHATAIVMTDIEIPDFLFVTVDPEFVIQGEEPMTFAAVTPDDIEVASFEWTNDNTGEPLGDTASITLEPNFSDFTVISVTVTDTEGRVGQGWATIIVDPGEQPIPSLFVMIDPPVVFQEENEPIEFEAEVEGAEPFTYEWIREDTGEVIGTEAEITLEPTFQEPTPIFLTVTDNDGNVGHATAIIMTDIEIPDFLFVRVDPEFVVQGNEPMTFAAVTPDDIEVASYEWFNDETGEPLGNTASITVEPNFTDFTVISVTVTDTEGRQGQACALIATHDDPNIPLVAIDPPMVVQESEPMEFEAVVAEDLDVTSYTWTNLNTGEVLGNEDEITLQPTFEEITTLGLTVTSDSGDVYEAQSLIIVPGDVPPFFFVNVDPPLQYQGEGPMTFTAQVEGNSEVESYQWMLADSDEVIGTEAAITLDPTFAETTELLVRVVSVNGEEGYGSALILVDEEIPNERVTIDPRLTLQGNQPMTFTAQIDDDEAVESYGWFNDLTNEPLGSGVSIELQPTFTEPTPIGVRVTFASGDVHLAFALILVDETPSQTVSINPLVAVQDEEPMTFTANIPSDIEVASITWTNTLNGETLGEGQSITLEPNFEISTNIAVTVVAADGTNLTAEALIVVGDVDETTFFLPTSPTVQTQGVDLVSIDALPPVGMELSSVEWRNTITDELLGTGPNLTFANELTELTPITVHAVSANGDEGIGFALVLVHPAGGDPDQDGDNDIEDLHSQLPEWNITQSVLELLTINIGL